MDSFKLLTFNCSAVPLLTPRVRRRLLLLAEEIKRLDPDIVCLQEIGLEWDARFLRKNLKDRWPYFFWSPSRRGIVAGGLVFFSKIPFDRARFEPYSEQGPWFGLGAIGHLTVKGMMILEMSQPKIRILHTHTLPDYARSRRTRANYALFQAVQHHQLSQRARQLSGEPGYEEASLILVGDLNVDPDYPILHRLKVDLGFVDLMEGVYESSMVDDHDFRTPLGIRHRPERIDYILVHPGVSIESLDGAIYALDVPVRIGRKNLTLSDHRGVLGEFVFG